LIYLKNISLSFGDKKLFDQITWAIMERSRIGLVGDNGTGKTTLFRAIRGQAELDEGSIEIPNRKNRVLGYLPQDLVEIEPVNIIDYIKKKSGIAELEKTIQSYEQKITRLSPDDEEYRNVLGAYESTVSTFNIKDGYAFEARAKQILKGIGFRDKDFSKNCAEFSGGWKMRILLAVILLSRPDIMLLDEPTNHLDTESMEWLESYLKNYTGTIITIAHDRVFLDKIVNQIAELSNRKITLYKGNYSYYLREKEKRLEALKKGMELQQAEIKRVQEFVERFRYKATKARQVQSRLKMLEKFEPLRHMQKAKAVKIKFPEGPKSGKEVVFADNISKSYGALDVFKDICFNIFRGDKIALVGVNGAGKSTLTRILSGTETPTSGEIRLGLNVKMAFFSQESAQNLSYNRSIWEEIRAVGTKSNDQQLRDLLGVFLFSGDDIMKSISVLSGGEKSRLALLKILLQDSNCLILDEPTNHLDLKTKDIFQGALLNYHGTIIIVSHDRYFLDHLVNRVFELRNGTCYEYRGNYSYFIEKRGESMEASPALPEKSTDEKNRSRKSKEEKRMEAEERNRLSIIRNTLQKKLTTIEQRINNLEAEKSENEALLCKSETLKDSSKVKKLNQESNKILRELESLYSEWESIAAQFDDRK
jgi:ATP-binding cassette subfamily F protein 3